jgi:hypothetical protein
MFFLPVISLFDLTQTVEKEDLPKVYMICSSFVLA